MQSLTLDKAARGGAGGLKALRSLTTELQHDSADGIADATYEAVRRYVDIAQKTVESTTIHR